MSAMKKYAVIKRGVPLPEGWRGDGRVLIDLSHHEQHKLSGRQSGHSERFTVDDRDVSFFDDPVPR